MPQATAHLEALIVDFESAARVQVYGREDAPALGGWFDARTGARGSRSQGEPFGNVLQGTEHVSLLERMGLRRHHGTLEMVRAPSGEMLVQPSKGNPVREPRGHARRRATRCVSPGGTLVVADRSSAGLFLVGALLQPIGAVFGAGPKGLVAFLEGGAVEVSGSKPRARSTVDAGTCSPRRATGPLLALVCPAKVRPMGRQAAVASA